MTREKAYWRNAQGVWSNQDAPPRAHEIRQRLERLWASNCTEDDRRRFTHSAPDDIRWLLEKLGWDNWS